MKPIVGRFWSNNEGNRNVKAILGLNWKLDYGHKADRRIEQLEKRIEALERRIANALAASAQQGVPLDRNICKH